MNTFFENIETAYKALEDRLNKDREEAKLYISSLKECSREVEFLGIANGIIFLQQLGNKALINPRKDLAGRTIIKLNEGYIAKVRFSDQLNSQFYVSMGDFSQNDFEEKNVSLLRQAVRKHNFKQLFE